LAFRVIADPERSVASPRVSLAPTRGFLHPQRVRAKGRSHLRKFACAGLGTFRPVRIRAPGRGRNGYPLDMTLPKMKRILLKLSGEVLMGN
ncbi:hypothetical protein ACKI1Q_44280, partial [Streptomyces galilaeus]|uniref:hypothetical protein n=1 Tax=Streptomyces galilaeus TaxID=33899 RepID=UPI0038F6765B